MGEDSPRGQAEEAFGTIVFQFQVHTRISVGLKKSLGFFSLPEILFRPSSRSFLLKEGGREFRAVGIWI
jgi:hypothetical protein